MPISLDLYQTAGVGVVAGFFRIHHLVGLPEHFAGRHCPARGLAVADGAAVRRFGDAAPEALHKLRQIVGGAAMAEDHEFVAADAINELTVLQRPLEAERKRDQRVVTGGVALGVVDGLEPVHVDRDQRREILRVLR